jgi:superfamily II DNA or RNA helicase
VRFDHGLEECEKSALSRQSTPLQALERGEIHAPLEVIVRTQAEAIESVNDTWGVFSRSRIALLPHQLWVCRKVLETWPARWLVADDVGLGKTIEAGIILWPLISKQLVRRLLILCPASLVEQWQYRLRTMFDIRVARYVPEADTPRADFWGLHSFVIASMQTLRDDHNGRHDRLLESEPWDLVIVDEAHHLNADEDTGATLSYKLLDKLLEAKRIRSMIFFSGTPHRGKDFGFLSLLRLLRPDLFHTQQSLQRQLPLLQQVLIRNNKQNVTDLKGNKLFQPPKVSSKTYQYSKEEAVFYEMLTEFIATGKAYASSLGENSSNGRAVMLVLIAMQKLASSSVAAIRRALEGRLERIASSRQQLSRLEAKRALLDYQEFEITGAEEERSRLEEEIAIRTAELRLMQDEETRLRELTEAARQVKRETKIDQIIAVLVKEYKERSVLFFTEYKATQSLLMSALIERFGESSVSFINGDDRADDVLGRSLVEKREAAANRFNSGEVRFLVSTEAGGEGIDLQEHCHTLIHVDLPWNPMRLHQRVGRLNRYGQKERVDVMTLRNPDTVEYLIWEKLNTKIEKIMQAFNEVMDEPEDLLQLVLGMTSPSMFGDIFSRASEVPRDSLSSWFDQQTARFGGKDVLDAVCNLVGHSSHFDFAQVSEQLPHLDLPALKPFFKNMLLLNRRQMREDEEGLSFITPEAWLDEPGVRSRYQGMLFERNHPAKDATQRLLGVGHKLMDQATRQAKDSLSGFTVVDSDLLLEPLMVYRVTDQITTSNSVVRSVIVAVVLGKEGIGLLRDWEVLELLNTMSSDRTTKREQLPHALPQVAMLRDVQRAEASVRDQLDALELTFTLPVAELITMLWPIDVLENYR